jgi:hypothetical protein
VPPPSGESPGPRSGPGRLLRSLSTAQRGSLLVLCALLASLLCALAAYAGVVSGTGGPSRGDSGRPEAAPPGVRIGGHAVGLYPGSVQRLRVHLDNLGRRPVTVRSLRAVVGDAGRHCPARNVSVSSHRGGLRLRPQRRRWVSLKISMRADAANACQHARFPLSYKARVGG